MNRIKTINELTIKDNFMFGAVMCNEEICREFLEMVLGFSIEQVTVCKVQRCIEEVKVNRELGGRYMILREMLAAEYAEGKAEGKAESVIMLLNVKGEVSEELKLQIMSQRNEAVLNEWLNDAVKCDSVEEFVESIKII